MRQSALDPTADLKELALMANQPGDLGRLLPRALEYLFEVIPYDLAAILALHGNELEVRCAKGALADRRVAQHRIKLSDFPSVQLALETRRTRVMHEHDHQGDGDLYDGVLDLPEGHACMVVPLFFGDRTLGAMTFDRRKCEVYPAPVVNLATIYGQIIALAMVAAERTQLVQQHNAQLKAHNQLLTQESHSAIEMLSHSDSPAMVKLTHMAQQVAATDAPVLVTGETGTGKELVARAIHAWSGRRDAAFVTLNCAALPEHLVESELFGHTKGAFTGAERARPGRFLVANGGTLLLDEVGELPKSAQAKLLRILQEGTLEPVGSDRTINVDVRIIAATHIDLEQAISEGRFREDLYYRLNVFPLTLPPLRERLEDLPKLTSHHLHTLHLKTGRGPWTLSARSLERLGSYSWPGNIRELVNILERATILSGAGELDVDLPPPKQGRGKLFEPASQPSSWPTLSALEREYIERVLNATDGKVYGTGGAAEILGLKPSTLQSRMAKLGLKRNRSPN